MNTKLLLAFLLMLSINTATKAKSFESMFSSSNEITYWVFKWYNLSGNIIDTVYTDGEHIVNGITYKKIALKSSNSSAAYPGGLLREDVATGEVWYRGLYPRFGVPDDTIERLAFRFDLQERDTFDISNTNLLPGRYPDSFNVVDSVKIVNGLRHIYFKGIDESCGEPYTIIEGVGSHMGILWKDLIGTERLNQYLLCSYKNGVKTSYINKAYEGSCRIDTGTSIGAISPLDKETLLYPQPASDKLYFQLRNGEKITRYEIRNLQGQLISTFASSSITEADLSQVPIGVNQIRLFSDGNVATSKIFIKQ